MAEERENLKASNKAGSQTAGRKAFRQMEIR